MLIYNFNIFLLLAVSDINIAFHDFIFLNSLNVKSTLIQEFGNTIFKKLFSKNFLKTLSIFLKIKTV